MHCAKLLGCSPSKKGRFWSIRASAAKVRKEPNLQNCCVAANDSFSQSVVWVMEKSLGLDTSIVAPN